MTAEQAAKRKWWAIRRWQGVMMIVAGVGLFLIPGVPDSAGLLMLGSGIARFSEGAGAAEERNSK